MGTITTLNVSFDSNGYDIPARIARRHLESLERERGTNTFLFDLAERSGKCRGLTTWGISDKIYGDEYFVKTLMPFWRDLLSGPEGDAGDGWPFSSSQVMVMAFDDASDQMRVYTIGWDDADNPGRALLLRRWTYQPFSWWGPTAGFSRHHAPQLESSWDGEMWMAAAP